MNFRSSSPPIHSPAITRLKALAPLSEAELDALGKAEENCQTVRPHHEIAGEGIAFAEPSVVVSGWAGRVRSFADGRRQILSVLLPGDLIGQPQVRQSLAPTMIVAITDVTLCGAPEADPAGNLARAYAASAALDESYLYRHVARLGRLSAYERIVDWLLETHERLTLAGLTKEDWHPLPMTQELLADVLGLTSVHVNRTLQMLRREGLIDLRGGSAVLLQKQRLSEIVEYRPTRLQP